MGSSSDEEMEGNSRPEEAVSARAEPSRKPYHVARELVSKRAPSPDGESAGEPKRNKRAAQPPANPRAPKGPKGRATRKRKPGPDPAENENYTRWKANRRAHKSARTQYNPCPGTQIPQGCIPILIMAVDVQLNRSNGLIMMTADEEECMRAQRRVGRRETAAPGSIDDRGNNANEVFDDMG